MESTILVKDRDVLKNKPETLFSPCNPTPVETIFLSNIDQAVAFPVETLFFFRVPLGKTLSSTLDMVERVKKAVRQVLVPYYFMAGRLSYNHDTKRLELVCNNAGAEFVSATSRHMLADLGDLSLPNPTFHRFVYRPGLYKKLADTPLFTIQVTRFKCGGISIGFMTNHGILDGKAASDMFLNLASICKGEPLKTQIICNDRTRIKARNPPKIQFPHKEYTILEQNPNMATSFTNPKNYSPSPLIFAKNYTYKLFHFTPEMLTLLKQKSTLNCSTFEAMVAHLWRSRTRAVSEDDPDGNSTVLFAMDIREKVLPNMGSGFAGNAVITAFATARVCDLVSKPLGFSVGSVKDGKKRVTEEYVWSVVDWLEVNRGVPATGNGSFYVSAWWKLPFGEVDFGLGSPAHGGPVASGNDEFVLLLNDGKKGINVWMGLEYEKMVRFMGFVFDI